MMNMIETGFAPEVKSVPDFEVKAAFEEFMSSFEAFKQANDSRLGELETRMGEDVLSGDKVDRISKALDTQQRSIDEMLLRKARPALGSGAGAFPSEQKQAFEAYIRNGNEQGIRALEEKAMSYGSGPDGGYLVPTEIETEIGKRLAALSPIRSIASVRRVSSALLKKPFALSGPATGWVGETAARTQTNSPTLAELQFPTSEIYAMPAATATLLEDSAVNLDQWISDEVELAFAEQEGEAFVTGNGSSKPRGFLDYSQVADANWAWDKIGYLSTGVSGGFAGSAPSDVLIDLIYSLRTGYREGASFVMNRKTQANIRKMKDADGNYLWQPPSIIGSRASLMGFPVVEAEAMPDIAANATAIAFGDFQRGYLVVDRAGVRVLRDPYSAKPYVLFYITKRVGGGVQDFSAIKLLKFSDT